MTIELLALDLDGTLISDLKTIPAETIKTIQIVIAQNVKVTLATGREYATTQPFAKKLNLNAPIICYQGGLIKDVRTEETWLSQTIDPYLSRAVIKFARSHRLPMLLFLTNDIFIELPSSYLKNFMAQLGTSFKLVHNLLCALDEDRLPAKFIFVQPEEQSFQVFQRLTEAFGPDLTIVKSRPDLVEVTHPKVSKGHALAYLAQVFDIPMTKTMAIGDEDNDISMLQMAGLGVAMGNASRGAKAAADVIAPSIDNHGAIWAMEKYILKTS